MLLREKETLDSRLGEGGGAKFHKRLHTNGRERLHEMTEYITKQVNIRYTTFSFATYVL